MTAAATHLSGSPACFGAVDRDGIGWIRPHHTILDRDVPVPIRTVRRLALRTGDRIEFGVSPGSGEATRVRCYRRMRR